jgi:eukaryotic-like serine/threonine-protein kinase
LIGRLVRGRYEVAGLIFEGPIFSAYAARDRQTGRDVCLRIVHRPFNSEPGFVQALKAVVSRYRALPGASIERIEEVFSERDETYLLGDLVRSPTLGDRIRKLAPFSIPASVSMAISLCQSIEPVHRAKLVHGDVSGQNVIVMANGDVKLQLTGIWEAYSASSGAGAAVLASLAPYLAPEVSQGDMPSPSSDVYAIGILMFELLTGRAPYAADSSVATAMRHVNSPTPSVRDLNPSVPEVLDEIVKKAMAKSPADRYRNATELMAHLRILQDALRFGKTLTWPLAGANARPTPIVNPSQPVAPRMSAIREPEDETVREKRRKERDVPIWMMLIIAFLIAVVLSLLGVWLAFNFSKPKLITVPNIRGLTTSEARSMLDPLKISLRILRKQADNKAPQDQILDVSPEPGQSVREGSAVGVVVSAGSRFIEVPDLKGETLDKAISVLNSLGLELDSSTDNAPDPSVPAGQVARQTPDKGTRVERGSRVRLTTSSGPPTEAAPTSEVPAFIYTLDIKVSNGGKSTRVRVDISDEQGVRLAYEERHASGETAHVSVKGYGPEATFRIYYDDVKVKELTQKAPTSENP